VLKTATLTVAIAAISALFALPASALPLAPLALQDGHANILTLVADGCGRGNVRIKGECYREVKEEDDDQPRSRKRARSNDDEDDDQPRKRKHSRNADNDDDRDCPDGFRYSNSRQKCVEKTAPAVKVLNKLLFGSGGGDRHKGNNQQGNNQGNARHKGACKAEPGCPCVNGRKVCH
jgi:hypothetical protein